MYRFCGLPYLPWLIHPSNENFPHIKYVEKILPVQQTSKSLTNGGRGRYRNYTNTVQSKIIEQNIFICGAQSLLILTNKYVHFFLSCFVVWSCFGFTFSLSQKLKNKNIKLYKLKAWIFFISISTLLWPTHFFFFLLWSYSFFFSWTGKKVGK